MKKLITKSWRITKKIQYLNNNLDRKYDIIDDLEKDLEKIEKDVGEKVDDLKY